MAVWDDILTERDREVISASGHSARRGFGKRPALFIVDAQEHFIGLDTDIFTSIARYSTSVGEDAWQAVRKIKQLLKRCRELSIPVLYSVSGTRNAETRYDSFQKKRSSKVEFTWIIDDLAPESGEVVIEKRFASAFNGTPLISFLNAMGVDTLLVCGFTTSGCVRGTVVDAAAYNYNVAVIADGCADRMVVSHKASLLDMDMKYGDVVTAEAAEAYLRTVNVKA